MRVPTRSVKLLACRRLDRRRTNSPLANKYGCPVGEEKQGSRPPAMRHACRASGRPGWPLQELARHAPPSWIVRRSLTPVCDAEHAGARRRLCPRHAVFWPDLSPQLLQGETSVLAQRPSYWGRRPAPILRVPGRAVEGPLRSFHLAVGSPICLLKTSAQATGGVIYYIKGLRPYGCRP